MCSAATRTSQCAEVVPAGVVHRWYNSGATPARIYVELRPSHARFEQALRVAYGLATDGLTNTAGIPKNILHLVLLAQMSDIRLVGPAAAMNPLFGALARLARRLGVEARLREHYSTCCA